MALQLQLHLHCSLMLLLTLHRHRLVVCKCASVHLCICALMHCSHGVQQSLLCFKDSEESPNYYYTAPLTGLWCALHHWIIALQMQQSFTTESVVLTDVMHISKYTKAIQW